MISGTKQTQEVQTRLAAGTARPTRVRHVILGLTVAAYVVSYMDRVVISTAVPSIQKKFGFSNVTIGWSIGSFQWAYALFQIPGGWLGDKIGARRDVVGFQLAAVSMLAACLAANPIHSVVYSCLPCWQWN